jgi:hypothetical protein
MRTIVAAMVAGVGILLIASLEAAATPADGASIARAGKQLDPVINAATKKRKKAQAQPQTDAKPACAIDQKRDRFGYCVPYNR